MRKTQTMIILVTLGLLFPFIAGAEDKQTPKAMNKIEPLPRDLEIQLALSALPPHLRENASVYVLNPDKGFEVARKGTNGFHTFVARIGDDTFRGCWPLTEYRDDILYPISFDAAGAKAQMRVFFDAAEMQAKGTPPDELKKIIKERYLMQYYKAPERAGVSYMVSPILRTYVNPDESDSVRTANVPHVMYYAPYVSNEEMGGTPPSIKFDDYRMDVNGFYPFVIMPGPHGYMIHLLDLRERAAINKEYEEMLGRLCNIKEVWCLPKPEGDGHQTFGFDNHTMKYVSTWIDSMSTGIYYFEGTASANLWGDYLSAWTAWNHTRPAARVRKEASLTTKLDIDNGYKCNTGVPLETSK